MKIERSIQNIELNDSELLTLVRKAFPNCQKLNGWKILSGGAHNTSYQIQIESDSFVLRIYARDRAHCKIEKSVHRLIENSVPVPRLIYADDSHEPWAYSIFEFTPGGHLFEVPYEHKRSLSHQLGVVLASIHSFKFPKAGLFGETLAIEHPFETGSSPYFEKAFSVLSEGKYARGRLGEELTNQMLAFMEKNRDFFPTVNKTSA